MMTKLGATKKIASFSMVASIAFENRRQAFVCICGRGVGVEEKRKITSTTFSS